MSVIPLLVGANESGAVCGNAMLPSESDIVQVDADASVTLPNVAVGITPFGG